MILLTLLVITIAIAIAIQMYLYQKKDQEQTSERIIIPVKEVDRVNSQKPLEPVLSISSSNDNIEQCTVALILPSGIGQPSHIIASLVNKLSDRDTIDFYFNSYVPLKYNDKSHINRMVQDAFKKDTNIILSVGPLATELTRKNMCDVASKRSIIFWDVSEEELKTMEEEQPMCRPNMTGIYREDYDYQNIVEVLKIVQPNPKDILIAYNEAGDYLKKDVEALVKHLKSMDINVQAVSGSSLIDLLKRIEERFSRTKVLITLNDPLVNSALSVFAEICKQRKILFFAYDLTGAEFGAAVSYGFDYNEYTKKISDMIIDITENQQDAYNIPITKSTAKKIITFNEQILKHLKIIPDYDKIENNIDIEII